MTGKESENTVESKVIEAMRRIRLIESFETCDLSRCGRTDKGVSSWANVIALTVRSNLRGAGAAACKDPGMIAPDSSSSEGNKPEKDVFQELDYCRALNKVLPDDIRAVAWAPVSATFDARFNCVWRTYRYYFLKEKLDIGAMREALSLMLGEHDFRNFCKIDVDNTKTWVRRILRADIVTYQQAAIDEKIGINNNINNNDVDDVGSSTLGGDHMYVVRITGSAFLWHQIRYIMAVLFSVGQKLERPDVVTHLLDVANVTGRPEYAMASDVPLVLFQCEFVADNADRADWEGKMAKRAEEEGSSGQLEWRYGEGCDGDGGMFSLHRQLRKHYEDLMLRAAVVHDMMRHTGVVDDKKKEEKYVPLLKRPRLPTVEQKQARKNQQDNADE